MANNQPGFFIRFRTRLLVGRKTDNPDEYAKIIVENFGIDYPEKFLRNFRDFTLESARPQSGQAISKDESGYIQKRLM